MAARLLFLGRLEDLAGAPERQCAVGPGATLSTLIESLEPDLAAALGSERVRVAVNGLVSATLDTPLNDGDEIAFLPPVSGG